MSLLESVGSEAEGFLDETGFAAGLLGESIGLIAKLRIRVGETLDQCAILGSSSSSIVLLTALFTGLVISLESSVQAVRYGVGDLVGGAVAFTTARELGPMLTGVVVAGRAGAAIAAEIGSMAVTEQIDALRALGLSPTRMLVVPRLLALFIMLPLLTVMSDCIAVAGGMWLAKSVGHIDYATFLHAARTGVHVSDVFRGLYKAAFFGMIIAIIGCAQGLRTKGGAAGVGRATTSAVVVSIILIFVSNFVLSFLLFGAE